MRGKVGRGKGRDGPVCLPSGGMRFLLGKLEITYPSVERIVSSGEDTALSLIPSIWDFNPSHDRRPTDQPGRTLGVLKVDGGSGGGTGHSLTHPLTCAEGGREGRGRGAPTDCCFPFSPHSQECTNERTNCRVVRERASDRTSSRSSCLEVGVGSISNAHPTSCKLRSRLSECEPRTHTSASIYFQLPQTPQQRGVLGFVGRRLQQRHVELGLRRAQRHAHHVRVHGRPRPHESLPQPGDTRRRQRRPPRSHAAPKAAATEQEAANRPAAGR